MANINSNWLGTKIPVLTLSMPVFYDALRAEHPAQGIIIGKAELVFGNLLGLVVISGVIFITSPEDICII